MCSRKNVYQELKKKLKINLKENWKQKEEISSVKRPEELILQKSS